MKRMAAEDKMTQSSEKRALVATVGLGYGLARVRQCRKDRNSMKSKLRIPIGQNQNYRCKHMFFAPLRLLRSVSAKTDFFITSNFSFLCPDSLLSR